MDPEHSSIRHLTDCDRRVNAARVATRHRCIRSDPATLHGTGQLTGLEPSKWQ
jgi:hypothetical protein